MNEEKKVVEVYTSIGKAYIAAFVLLKLSGNLVDISWWWILIGLLL